jgi:hypothetical protein
MEDEVITIVFGSLSAVLALVGISVTYLQLRGSRRHTATPDMEQALPPTVMVQEELDTDPPAAVVQEGPLTNLPAVMVQEEALANSSAAVVEEKPVTIPPSAVVREEPVTNPPYAFSVAAKLYNRADNATDATPRIDLLSAIDCQQQCTRFDGRCNTTEALDEGGSCV